VVRVGGVVSKPELNGKFGTVLRAANEAGRLGVRLEGGKESKSQPFAQQPETLELVPNQREE